MLSKGSAAVLPALLLGIIWWRRTFVALGFIADRAVFRGCRIADDGEPVVPNARRGNSGPERQFYRTPAGCRRRDMVLSLQGAVADQFGFCLFAMANQSRQSAVVAAAFCGADRYGRFVAISGNLEPVIVCLPGVVSAWRMVPVLGFADVGFMRYSLVADHYQHIAIIAVVALAAAHGAHGKNMRKAEHIGRQMSSPSWLWRLSCFRHGGKLNYIAMQ